MRLTVNPSTGAVELRPDATSTRRTPGMRPGVIATIPRAYTSPETLRDIARQLAEHAARVEYDREVSELAALGSWAPTAPEVPTW
jgi:hypothetical protein